MLVKEICSTDVVCCGPQTSAFEAARLMRHHHVGDVIVVDDPERAQVPLGVITDRDLAIEVLATGRAAATTAVATLLRTPVVIARESEDTRSVAERMRANGVRRIPVVDERGALAGIVTFDDLLRGLVAGMQLLLETQTRAQRHEQSDRR